MPSSIHPEISDSSSERRIVSVVLPDLLCELARASLSPRVVTRSGRKPSRERIGSAENRETRDEPPFGVLLVESAVSKDGEEGRVVPAGTAVLAAVNEKARHFGVRSGQTVAEAHAFVAHLAVKEVASAELQSRLGEVAEVAMAFGPTVSLELPDTVWVDVTGASHLSGGEERLLLEMATRVQALGHRARVVIAGGPKLAQAFARWGKLQPEGIRVVRSPASVGELPVKALPIDSERITWLVHLGVHTIGDLARLPRAAAASRLGESGSFVLDLAEGRDEQPLVPYVPPHMPTEETIWDDPVDGSEPLLFFLRGLVSRLSARLEGRGEAVQAIDLVISHDRAVARLEGTPTRSTLHFDLATPLHRAEELSRVISSRLSRFRLPAPSVGLRLEARAITRTLALQLSLSRYAAGLGGESRRGPETLPIVLAELAEDLGKDRVGVLQPVSSHRPENKSRLSPVSPELLSKREPSLKSSRAAAVSDDDMTAGGTAPTRLFQRPLPFDAPLRAGATVSLEHRLYTVERAVFDRRLKSVEWWTKEPVSRDYWRVWLSGSRGGVEAMVYVDRSTGARKVQGICD